MSDNDEHALQGDFQVVEILKPTSAKMLKNCKVGDVLRFKVVLKPAGGNGYTYATYITITNILTGESTEKSFNQLDIVYRAFKLENY